MYFCDGKAEFSTAITLVFNVIDFWRTVSNVDLVLNLSYGNRDIEKCLGFFVHLK